MTSLIERPNLARPDKKTIQELFDAIPDQYDFLNSFMSFGLDLYWRRMTAELAITGLEARILDLGVGTGKSLAYFVKEHQFELAVGCDFSLKMMERAKNRVGKKADFIACDFHELPFASGSFELITGSFMLRSVQDMAKFLDEVRRVLTAGGKAVFLELTRPQNRMVWKLMYEPYLKYYVPFIGRILSRHKNAYDFLSQSVQSFIEPDRLAGEFRSAGFAEVSSRPFTFGAVTIIQASAGSL